MSAQSRIKSALQPVNDLVMINVETTGEILLRQNAFFGDLVKSSVDQVRTLREANSIRDAIDAQRNYLREMGSKVGEVSRENLDTLREGGKHAREVLTGAYRQGREQASEAVGQGREAVDRGREDMAGRVHRAGEQLAETVSPDQENRQQQQPSGY